MAKKQPKNEPVPRQRTIVRVEDIEKMAGDVADLAKKLASVATKMRDKSIASMETLGIPTWEQGFGKISGSTRSIERAWEARSSLRKSIQQTIDEKEQKYSTEK